MPTIIVNNQRINYFFNGRKTPQLAIILVHGAGGRSQSWPYQWQQTYATGSSRRWVSDYPVYIPDLPGHGESELPGHDSIATYAEFVIAFVERLGLTNYVIAGHSMGGAIAQTVGLRQPDGLRGLILLGSGAQMVVNDAILEGLQTTFEKTVHMITKFSWHKEATPAFVTTGIAHMLTTEPSVVYGDFLACSRFDVREQVGEMAVPVLIVGGSDDKMMRLSMSESMHQLMPTSQLAVIEGAGHFMMNEKTAATTKVVVQFMAEIEAQL